VVDQDIGVRKDSKEIQQKLLSMASWPLDILTFIDRKQKT
jgi:hypothetical protein